MLAKVHTCAIVGLDGALVEVEVDIGHGLPSFTIVGLPDTAVNEAKERVRAAIKNSGCSTAKVTSQIPARHRQWKRLETVCHEQHWVGKPHQRTSADQTTSRGCLCQFADRLPHVQALGREQERRMRPSHGCYGRRR